MKKIKRAAAWLIASIILFQVAGCKKIIDKFFPGNGGKEPEEKECRIIFLREEFRDDGISRTGRVFYNEKGNPDSVIFDRAFSAVSPYKLFYFTYNNNHELVGYKALSEYDAVEKRKTYFSHRYTYENGRITKDTTDWINHPSFSFSRFDRIITASALDYDTLGRIIKDQTFILDTLGDIILQPIISNYHYDVNGNLPSSYFTYDTTVKSYLSTNNVWMFIRRNYSQNSPNAVSSTNERGLPTGFNTLIPISDYGVFGPEEPREIRYDCE